MEAIADEIRFGKNPFITVCDDTTSEFLHANIKQNRELWYGITDFA